MRFIMNVAINMAVFLACTMLFPSGFQVANLTAAFLAAVVLALLNIILKPILLILSLPILVLTLGLFMIIINGFLLELTAKLMTGFTFASFGWAMLVSVILAIVNFIFTNQTQVKIER